jgi:hypothetical protein
MVHEIADGRNTRCGRFPAADLARGSFRCRPAAHGGAEFGPPGFYSFGVGEQLTYSCQYLNDSGQTVAFGESYFGDENCNGLAYFFPANAPRFCVNNILIP